MENQPSSFKKKLSSFIPSSPYIISYLIIFIVLWETKGMSDAKYKGFPTATTALIVTFFFLMAIMSFQKKIKVTGTPKYLNIVLLAQFVFFLYANFSPHEYVFNYTKVLGHLTLFNIIFYSSLGIFVLSCILKKYQTLLYHILFGLSILLSVVVIYCSIDSGIDTHLFLNMASDYLLNGKNPYNYNYPDIYNGEYSALYGDKYYFNYWPLALYIGSIFRFLMNDVRYSFVLAQIIFGIIMVRSKKLLNLNQVLLFATIWLVNMVVLFVNERSWLDALVPPFLLGAVLLIQKRKFGWAAVLLGLMASIKLYYIFVLPFFGIYYLKEKKWKEIFIMAIAFASSFVPFLILSFDNFYFSTITFINGTKIREDSLSFVSVVKRLFNIDASFAGFIAMFSFMGLFLLLYLRSKNNLLNLLKYVNLTFFGIFLLSKQSFCNYFYFNMLIAFVIFYLESNFDHEQKTQHGIHI